MFARPRCRISPYVRKRERPVWMDTEPLPGSAIGGNL